MRGYIGKGKCSLLSQPPVLNPEATSRPSAGRAHSRTVTVYKASDLIFQSSVNVPKGYLINYNNMDGGDSFKYTLGNPERIKYFILSVYDQDGNTITDMTDYIMHIQFEVNDKSKKEVLMKTLIDYNKQSYLVLGHIFDMIYNIYNSIFKKQSNT
jgi:hypothetical protein